MLNRLNDRAALSVVTLLATLALARPACAEPPSSEDSKVAASVNGKPITRGEIMDDLLKDQAARVTGSAVPAASRAGATAATLGGLAVRELLTGRGTRLSLTRDQVTAYFFKEKPPVLADAIQNKIRSVVVELQAKKAGITIAESDITKQLSVGIDSARKRYKLDGKSDDQVVSALGARLDAVRKAMRTSLMLEQLVKKDHERTLGHPIGVGDYLDARHILITPAPAATAPGPNGQTKPATDADREKGFADARVKAQGIFDEIKAGKKTFEKAAQDSSDDTGSKFSGGKLGVFLRGQMVKEFEAAAFSQPTGQPGAPIRSQFGWHIIIVDRAGKDIAAGERDQAFRAFVTQRMQSFIAQLVKSAKITNTVPPPPPAPTPNFGGGAD